MASMRNQIRIARAPDDVWKVVSDAGALAAWATGVERSSVSGNMRHVELAVGFCLEEEIVTSDDALRRFQYRIVESNVGSSKGPVSNLIDHLATVDVIEDGAGSLVIYSADVVSADDPGGQLERVVAESARGITADFLQGLKEYLER
jgi:carbon monoxide dehydrogenase subunit G